MNAKYAVALILALQVSMSLCELPTPSDELSLKYDGFKTTFLQRCSNLLGKLTIVAKPLMDQIETSEDESVKAAKDALTQVKASAEYQAIFKVFEALSQDPEGMMDTTRKTALGLYETYLRPQIGNDLNNMITTLKQYLDLYFPAQ